MIPEIVIKPKFQVGDRVYHVLPESPMGIVTDITYRFTSGIIWYEVVFDPENGAINCQEFELCTERRII